MQSLLAEFLSVLQSHQLVLVNLGKKRGYIQWDGT